MSDRRLFALHAAAAGGLATAFLLGLEPVADTPALLPWLLGLAALVALASPWAALAGAPAWAAAASVSSAEPAGIAAGLAVVGAFALLSVAARRAPVLAAAIVLGLATGAPLLRFTTIALHGFDRPWLRYFSPVELPALALAIETAPEPPLYSGGGGNPLPRPPLPASGGPRESPKDADVRSLGAGLFRPGVPVALAAGAPHLVGGADGAWFAGGPGTFYPVLHERPPVGGAIDWQPVQPGERLRFQKRGSGYERRRAADGWTLTGKDAPGAPAVLEAFDEVQDAPRVFRVIQAHRAGAERVADPAVAPGRYDALETPRFPDDVRRRLALAAALGTLAAAIAGALGGWRAGAPVAVLAAAAVAFGAGTGPGVIASRSIYRLVPNEPTAVAVEWIDASAPARRARLDFEAAGEGLTPVLPSYPDAARFEVRRTEGGEQVRGLVVAGGDRRLFRAVRAVVLPGPIERDGEAIRNRTGVDFAEGWLVRDGSVRPVGAFESGATLGAPGEATTFAQLRDELDRRGREGRELRRLLALEIGNRSPAGGWLVLVARGQGPAAIYIVAL